MNSDLVRPRPVRCMQWPSKKAGGAGRRLPPPFLGASAVLAILALLGAFEGAEGQGAARATPGGPSSAAAPKSPDYTLEGPFVHQNLAVYLVRGQGTDTSDYITLDEGLTSGSVAVGERGGRGGQDQAQVNRLEIENKSDRWLFLQAGDIVKGGKQDRTIGIDVALAPRSKPQPIDAFCVEHGRWTPKTDGLAFRGNTGIVSSNALKISIQGEKNQSRVWEEVARQESKAVAVAAPAGTAGVPQSTALSVSGTYNAIVENDKISSSRKTYVAALLPSLQKPADALGMIVAINGEITAADVYDSAPLFRKLSRKLLDSYALEALLARDAKAKLPPLPSQVAALAFLSEPSKAEGKDEKVTESMHRRTRETGGAVLYEYTATDPAGKSAAKPVHRNYIKK